MLEHEIKKAAELIRQSSYTVAFTGAGISVESGIPPFRGEGGLWNSYDPSILDLDTYLRNPERSWPVIRSLFYDFFGTAQPNDAHYILAEMERLGLVKDIITQNIDNLHQKAGSKKVYEFHGRLNYFVCPKCHTYYKLEEIELNAKPPQCLSNTCRAVLKPDFIFFGEGIPEQAYINSMRAARNADVLILIGTSGEIMPASSIPIMAKQKGCKIIEINPNKTNYTSRITDTLIQAKASEGLSLLFKEIKVMQE